MFAYIGLCRENLVDKIGCFGTSRNVDVESGIRISRLKTQFAVIRFDPKRVSECVCACVRPCTCVRACGRRLFFSGSTPG